jgi:hypothetical protein
MVERIETYAGGLGTEVLGFFLTTDKKPPELRVMDGKLFRRLEGTIGSTKSVNRKRQFFAEFRLVGPIDSQEAFDLLAKASPCQIR